MQPILDDDQTMMAGSTWRDREAELFDRMEAMMAGDVPPVPATSPEELRVAGYLADLAGSFLGGPSTGLMKRFARSALEHLEAAQGPAAGWRGLALFPQRGRLPVPPAPVTDPLCRRWRIVDGLDIGRYRSHHGDSRPHAATATPAPANKAGRP